MTTKYYVNSYLLRLRVVVFK